MRISQIKTLCWLSNGLVLIGAGYVGLHFWKTYKARSVRAEVAWPAEDGAAPIKQRWPGAITGFGSIWATPVNGEVPPPPKPPDRTPPKRDLARDFLAKYQFLGMFLDSDDSLRSVAFVKPTAAPGALAIRAGTRLEKFTLVAFDVVDGKDQLVFTHPEVEELIRLKLTLSEAPELTTPELAFELKPETDLAHFELREKVIETQAYKDRFVDPSGLTWRLTKEETAWWAAFGESAVLSKMSVQNKTDAEGRPVGITIRSQPGQGTPIAERGRGILVGDTIKAINGVTVGTKEDIVSYLRGDGNGLERYDVLVEDETGRERTVVYLVRRNHRS